MRKITTLLALLVLVSLSAGADDAYLIRFQASYWRDDVLFFNTGATSAQIRFLGVSNSTPKTDDVPSLELAPQQLLALRDDWPIAERWAPNDYRSLYILHLDIPKGVVIESRNEFWVVIPSEGGTTPLAKTSLPVFRELTPGNVPQVHLGTDIGRATSHINVGIYNAATETATARVDVRRPCDDVPVTTKTVTIPPNTVIQVGALQKGTDGSLCTYFGSPWGFVRTVTVQVDQPSLSFVSNILDGACSVEPTVPCVGFTASINARY